MSEKMISETEAKLSTHEQICAQRYEAIQRRFDAGSKRMARLEYLLYGVFGPGVAAEFVKKTLGM